MSELLDEFRDFLKSVKTSEALSEELRLEITVETGMEAPLAEAIAEKSIVVIAGTAGGGKTHLLKVVENQSALPFIEWGKQTSPQEASSCVRLPT